MDKKMLRIEEVALLIGCSAQTINNWYRFKRQSPDNELVKLLPDYVQVGVTNTRFWKYEDIWKLVEFKSKLPQGRNGIMGDVTQKYLRNKKLEEMSV